MSSNKELSLFPKIIHIEKSSQIKSDELNTMFASIEESILRSILKARVLTTDMKNLKLATTALASSFSTKAQEISYRNQSSSPYNMCVFADDVKNKNYLDTIYGYIRLPIKSSYTKIPRSTEYANGVSPLVVVIVDGIEQASDSEIYSVLDGKRNSFWIKQVPNDGADHTIIIQLPPSLNNRFNYFECVPFPIFGMEIKSVTYFDKYGIENPLLNINDNSTGTWNPISNSRNDSHSNVMNGTPFAIHTNPTESNGTFKLVVKALNGVIGFNTIDIRYVDYDNVTTDYQYITTTINNPRTNQSSKNFTLSNFLVDYYSQIGGDDSGISVQLVKGPIDKVDETVVSLVDIYTKKPNSSINIALEPGKRLYFRFKFIEVNNTTPVIKGISFNSKEG